MMVKVENCGGHNPSPPFTSLIGSIEAAPGCEHPTLTVCWKVEDGQKVVLFKEIFDRGPVGNDFKRAGVPGPVI